MLKHLIQNMPEGPLTVKVPRRIPAGEAISRYEAPRGEDIHYVRANGTEMPERVKVRAPTMANLASIREMLKGGFLADFPIVIAAIDPCFSCTDRAIQVINGKNTEIMDWRQLQTYSIEWYKKRGIDLSGNEMKIAGGEIMEIVWILLYMLVFPGFLFLATYGMVCEWVDRKLYARFQSRIGPPWFQPEADFIKLMAKEEIIPEAANPVMFRLLPIFALAAVLTAFLYIPVWDTTAIFAFPGDFIVVFYLLTIPTFTFFLAGWHSTSLYSTIGSVRNLTQLFAYEVPLLMSLLGPALLAGSWSLSGINQFFLTHPVLLLVNIIGFGVALVAVQGKLERVPFDIPEAETEIVAGSLTEFSGKLLGIFRLAIDLEMVVAAALLSAVFLGGSFGLHPVLGFLLFIVKTLLIVAILALFRTVMARIRIEQMMRFCWRYLAPIALFQLVINIIVKAWFL